MLSGNLVRLGCRLGSVRHRLLIDGDAFACHGGLVDARSPDHDEPVCCQPFIGLYDYGVANDEFLDGNFAQTAVASPNHGSARRQFSQGLDRAFGPAHGVMRTEEHTSELQSLMRISYAVFCLKKKT